VDHAPARRVGEGLARYATSSLGGIWIH